MLKRSLGVQELVSQPIVRGDSKHAGPADVTTEPVSPPRASSAEVSIWLARPSTHKSLPPDQEHMRGTELGAQASRHFFLRGFEAP
jgi:hypothetical protein